VESLNKKIQNLFVVGTDTGVGKTVLALLMMQFFFTKGYNPFYLKPVQTGCKDANDADSDARFIYRHVRPLKGKEPAESVIYCFKKSEGSSVCRERRGKVNRPIEDRESRIQEGQDLLPRNSRRRRRCSCPRSGKETYS
jgi:dethiobiotin synthetase